MGLLGKERRDIFLLGPDSPELRRALEDRNLRALNADLEKVLRTGLGGGRAILALLTPHELAKTLTHALRPAVENGLAFGAMDAEAGGYARVQELCGPDHVGRLLGIPSAEAAQLSVRAFAGRPLADSESQPDWRQRMAQFCADHDPGRSASDECEIEYKGGDENAPDAEDAVLVRRAFNDCGTAKLTYLSGGQSRAKGPWMIDAQYPRGRDLVKFVLKTGPISEISTEIENMHVACFHRIPFRHYPPVALDRCVIGGTKRAIVSMLVEDAQPLEKLIDKPAGITKIADIFTGPLRLWRKQIFREALDVGSFCRDRAIIPPNDYQLTTVWKKARDAEAGILRYNELYKIFMNQPRLFDVRFVQAHGDLHLRNILVHERTGDVLLIDFSRCAELPAFSDPATLDVSLAFDVPELAPAESRPGDQHLLDIYGSPLLGRDMPPGAPKRVGAIVEVRRQISDQVTEKEYRLAIAGGLIWQAWKRRNALAYRCASRLLA